MRRKRERAPSSDGNHFKATLDRNEIEFDTVVPYLRALLTGQSSRVVNHHFYQIAAKQAAAHSDIVGSLIEQAVLGELKSLDSGGREVWHPKDSSEALHVIEQDGPEHKERVAQIRKLTEPYRKRAVSMSFMIFDSGSILGTSLATVPAPQTGWLQSAVCTSTRISHALPGVKRKRGSVLRPQWLKLRTLLESGVSHNS